MDKQKIIDEIMDNFDFGRVQCAMEAVEWVWDICDGEVPVESYLRLAARDLLKEVLNEDEGYRAGNGGLLATRLENGAKLAFEMDNWKAYDDEDDQNCDEDDQLDEEERISLEDLMSVIEERLNEQEGEEEECSCPLCRLERLEVAVAKLIEQQ